MKPVNSSLLGHGVPSTTPAINAAGCLPAILTIEALIRLPDSDGGVLNRAKLSAAGGVIWVEWRSQVIDPRLRRGRRVMAPRDLGVLAGRCVPVHGLLLLGELPLL